MASCKVSAEAGATASERVSAAEASHWFLVIVRNFPKARSLLSQRFHPPYLHAPCQDQKARLPAPLFDQRGEFGDKVRKAPTGIWRASPYPVASRRRPQ